MGAAAITGALPHDYRGGRVRLPKGRLYRWPEGGHIAPGGREVALKTFNPQLGIEGAFHFGTTGIVEPMSLKALVDTIGVEMDMHAAEGATRLVLTPGNMGSAFAEQWLFGVCLM